MSTSKFTRTAGALLACLVITTVFAADDASAPKPAWPSPRLPFQPELTQADAQGASAAGKSVEDPACPVVLGAARKMFLGSSAGLDLDAALARMAQRVAWTPLELPFEKDVYDKLEVATVEIHHDGVQQVLVRRAHEQHGWRGPQFDAFLFTDKAALDAALGSSKNIDEVVSRGSHFYPVNDKEDWIWNEVFQLGEGVYFFHRDHWYPSDGADDATLYRLAADGSTSAACHLKLMQPDRIAAFMSRPALKLFLKVLGRIGTGGPDCGTLHSSGTHEFGARSAVWRAALRPWAVGVASKVGDYYDGYSPRIEAFLFAWGVEDPWNRREFLTLDEHRRAAEREMAQYLAAEFGLDKAQAAAQARRAIDDVVAAHLLLPASYTPELWAVEPAQAYQRAADPYDVRLVLFDPNERHDRIPRSTIAVDGVMGAAYEVTLFAILDDPIARRAYLKDAVDKEAPNDFGKTLLMSAAHLNQLDAVKEFLAAGANVNAATPLAKPTCEKPMKHQARTPLMYAAENASFEVMDALVAAGALTDARDSEGVSVDDYLARNPRLASLGAPAPKTVGEALERFHQRPTGNEPSFSCAGSLSELEKIICTDPVAALYDREMATHFAAWKAKLNGAGDPVADQIDWIRRRNRGCGAMEGEDVKRLCVEETLRARSRYLENRLAE